MYRVTKMANKFYAIKIESVEDDLESIEVFASEDTLIIIGEDLKDIAHLLNIDKEDIEVVQ